MFIRSCFGWSFYGWRLIVIVNVLASACTLWKKNWPSFSRLSRAGTTSSAAPSCLLATALSVSKGNRCLGLPSVTTFDHLWRQWTSWSENGHDDTWWHMTCLKLTVFISCWKQRSPTKHWLDPAFGYFAATTGLLWRFLMRTWQMALTPWWSFWRGMILTVFSNFCARTNGYFFDTTPSITHSISVICRCILYQANPHFQRYWLR